MHSKPALAMLLAATAVTVLVIGCGRGDGPTLAPVAGTVTHNQQPLAEGTITFYPAAGRPAYGKIQNGQIVEVTTLDPNDGVTVGTSRVSIQSVEQGADMYTESKSRIPERYANPEQSGLTAEITEGQTNDLTFGLKD